MHECFLFRDLGTGSLQSRLGDHRQESLAPYVPPDKMIGCISHRIYDYCDCSPQEGHC